MVENEVKDQAKPNSPEEKKPEPKKGILEDIKKSGDKPEPKPNIDELGEVEPPLEDSQKPKKKPPKPEKKPIDREKTEDLLIHQLRETQRYLNIEPKKAITQKEILVLLNEKESLTQKDIAQDLRAKLTTVGELLAKLEFADLVKRHPNKEDHRVFDISLTNLGKKIAKEYTKEENQNETLFTVLDDKELGDFSHLLDKVLNYFREKHQVLAAERNEKTPHPQPQSPDEILLSRKNKPKDFLIRYGSDPNRFYRPLPGESLKPTKKEEIKQDQIDTLAPEFYEALTLRFGEDFETIRGILDYIETILPKK